MRISTSQMHERSLTAMLEKQAELSKTQMQISTGRRIVTPADDPSASARLIELDQQIEANKQYQKNADAAQANLFLEEAALMSVGDTVQRVRELALQANNDSQTNETRVSIALELRERLDELLGLANTRGANNEYLFSGYKSDVQPFSQSAGGGFTYNGDQNQIYVQIGPTTDVAVGDAGTDVFVARNGNGVFVTSADTSNAGTGIIDAGSVTDPAVYQTNNYTISIANNTGGQRVYLVYDDTNSAWIDPPTGLADDASAFVSGGTITFNGVEVAITGSPQAGDTFTVTPSENQDLFTTIQNLIDTLEQPTTTAIELAHLHADIGRVLTDLDQGMDKIMEARAKIGARLGNIDSQKSVNEDFLLNLESIKSDLKDLNYTEAITRFNQQLLAVQAAQQTYAKVQGMSLFNYL